MTAVASPPSPATPSETEPAKDAAGTRRERRSRATARHVPRYLPAAEVGLAALTLAAAVGFARVFDDNDFLAPLVIVAIVMHLLTWAGRRLGWSVPVVGLVGIGAFALVTTWTLFFETTLMGIPTGSTTTAVGNAFSESWTTFQTTISPAPTQAGFVLASAIAVAFAVFLADWAAFRLWSSLEAIVPTLTLFIFCSLFGSGEQREIATALFATAALAFLLFHRTAQRETSAGWLTSDVNRGSDALVRRGALIGAAAIIFGVVIGPHLPGARSPMLVPWRGSGSNPTRTVISPLVNIQDRLLNQSDVEVFTVEADRPAYWRLTALDEFEGDAWKSGGSYNGAEGDLNIETPATSSDELKQTFDITNLAALWAPAAYMPVRLESSDKELRFQEESATLIVNQSEDVSDNMRYTVVSKVPTFDVDALRAANLDDVGKGFKDTYLALPSNFSEQARTIAKDVTKDQTSLYDKALALENYFSGPDSAFRYNQTVPAGHGEPAIERFLANKQGYCEQFAGTYAAMARSIGVPARVAVGFTPGTQDPTNPKLWRVTGKYAHAWPEVYLGRQLGWVPFEPTPNRGAPNAQGWTGRAPMQAPADGTSETVGSIPGVAPSSLVPVGPLPGEDPNRIETDGTTTTTVATTTTVPPDRPLVGLDSPIQILTTGGISIVLLAILGAGYLALVIALRARVWQRRRTAARDASAAVLVSWQECLEQLALLGIRQRPTETTEELAQRAAPYLDNLAPAFLGLAGTVEAAMFSPTVLDPADATAATQLTDALTHHVEARTTRARQWQDRLDPRPIVDDFRQRHTRPREDELV